MSGMQGTDNSEMYAVWPCCCADVDWMAATVLVSDYAADVGANTCDVYQHGTAGRLYVHGL